MKIVHLTSSHTHPFDSRIFYKECRSLHNAGHQVTLIKPHAENCVVDGISIKAVPQPKNGKDRIKNTTRKVYELALKEDGEAIFHVHDFELIFYAWRLALRGHKVVYDCHEDMPRLILIQHWIPTYLKPFVAVFTAVSEWVITKFFWKIIAAEPVTARRFPKKKTVLIQNFPIKDELILSSSVNYMNREPIFVYIGGITKKRGAFEMVDAIELVENEQATLLLAGNFFSEKLEKDIKNQKGWDRTEFLGYKSRKGIAELLNKSLAGLVLLHPVKRYRENFPIKLFEYMSVGIPVIASDTPVMRKIVLETKCGILVNPLNIREIYEAMAWILENPEEARDMGRQGMQAIKEKYSWENEEQKLLKLYSD